MALARLWKVTDMGLWLKQEDGTLVEVGGGGGGGGSFDGEHVLTGDPGSPPEGWAAGQLLYDGVEDAADSSGPHDHDDYALVEHDHDEYALVEHDHNEFTHDHDYLPLAGGKLDSGAQITARGTNAAAPAYSFAANPGAGMYLANGTGAGIVGLSGELWVSERLRAPSLQVDGTITGTLASGTHAAGDFIVDNVLGLPALLSDVGLSGAQPNLCLDAWGWIRRTNWTPSRMAFAPSKLVRDSDVLQRAETATLPPEMEADDDGNVLNADEIEAHDTVELFDVVTALLAKVKELSAEIEELKGN